MIYPPTLRSIQIITSALHRGELSAIPTETVYGLAANALNPIAVHKIFTVKKRPFIDPLIVHVFNSNQAKRLAYFNIEAEKLIEAFSPGPLTLILPKKNIVPDIVTAGKKTIAIRLPANPIMREVLKISGLPLAAPSANPFSYVSPTLPIHVQHTLGNHIDFILDGGPCLLGIESTIINIIDPENPKLLRPGPVEKHSLEKVLKKPIKCCFLKKNKNTQKAPGMFNKHYSPKTPCYLLEFNQYLNLNINENIGLLWLKKPNNSFLKKNINVKHKHFWLTKTGNLQEAAKNLYSLIQEIDQNKFEKIFIENIKSTGLGIAINDRIKKACSIL